ncbi:unnamed protein product [Bursaphelenchus okinawaensis]|uniref:Amino acid transporter transmembrane domain-containing protein n=1 Tax=Bursaphelenchus okinawaensis TaxID=465554 RepID=A0A811L2G7_9BILA|nr:unnamed protein product [Bursaphelenchus okinawaensis]CAG9115015.1 unnamed protein product [Bursaphelenchus okinawaensis]
MSSKKIQAVADPIPQKRNKTVSTVSDGEYVDGKFYRPAGMHWVTTALFILGDVAGGGLVTLPVATVRTSLWACFCFTFYIAVTMGMTGILLGKCWMMMLERWPEYRNHCRKPYAEIAKRALGQKYVWIVSLNCNIAQFGQSVVYLLLSAKNLRDLILMFFDYNISYCFMVVFLGILLLPLNFLKSPQDFWPMVIVAMFTSVVSASLIVAGGIIDYPTCSAVKEMPPFTPSNYFLALGTFFFAYEAHASFPTVQHDMRRPAEWTKSMILAMILISSLYGPVSVISYFSYGDSVKNSIINSVQTPWIQITVNLLITMHCILTITIASNPLNQELEDYFNVPHDFGYQRVILRTSVMALQIFSALSVPNFGALMDLVGATASLLTALFFPCLFYLTLKAGEVDGSSKANFIEAQELSWTDIWKRNKTGIKWMCVIATTIGTSIGLVSSVMAIRSLADTHFVPPCYIQPFLSNHSAGEELSLSAIDCCGHYQNISVYEDVTCSIQNLKINE